MRGRKEKRGGRGATWRETSCSSYSCFLARQQASSSGSLLCPVLNDSSRWLGDRMEKGGCPLSLGFSVAFNSPAARRIGSPWIQDSKEENDKDLESKLEFKDNL